MKLSSIFTSIAAIASLACQAVAEEVATPKVSVEVDYVIKERPEFSSLDMIELFNGDTITLEYTITNTDETQVGIVGVGGSFNHPKTLEIDTNITSASVGPIILEPGETHKFNQAIQLNLVPEIYVLTPVIFITHSNQVLTLSPRQQLAVVQDYPLSLFNPQLLLLEVVLLATFGGLAYFLYQLFGKTYLKGTAPTKKSVPAQAPLATASGKYDSSWIPEHHIKKTKKKN